MPEPDLWALFDEAAERRASDVHLSCGRAPLFRVDGPARGRRARRGRPGMAAGVHQADALRGGMGRLGTE